MARADDAELRITAALDDKVTAAIQLLSGQVTKLGEEAQKAFKVITDANEEAAQSAEKTGRASKKAGEEMKDAGEKGAKGFEQIKDKLKDVVVGLFGLQQAFSVFKSSIQDTVTTAQEVDVINARIKNFTNLTGESFNQLADDLRTFSLANKQFVKDQEVSTAALLLLKDGFSSTSTVIYDVAEAYDFAQATGTSLTDSVRLLLEANKALGDGTNNSVEILSRLNFLFGKGFDNAGALAGALAALSNTARQTGLKLDDAAVSIATLSETSSAGEALRNLEVILKALQSRGADVSTIFAAAGRQFDQTTIQSAGLKNTLSALIQSIIDSGGDAQTELKKLFGSQEAVNAVLALGAQNSERYSRNVKALADSTNKLIRDTNSVREAQGGFIKFISSEGYDVIDNYLGAYRQLDGSTGQLVERSREFSRAKAAEARDLDISRKSLDANAEAITRVLRTSEETFGGQAVAPRIVSQFESVAKAAKVTLPDIEDWYSTVSGQQVDADLERINKQIERLTQQAYQFAAAGIEGFDSEGLKFRLQEIADFQQVLQDELFASRKAAADKADADARAKSQAQFDADVRALEQLELMKQQQDKADFDRRVKQAQELQAMTEQLVSQAMQGGDSSFLGRLIADSKQYAQEIQLLQGVIANSVLSEIEYASVSKRIDDLKAKIAGLAIEGVRSANALKAGFSEALTRNVSEALDNIKMGASLAQATFGTLTNSLAGFFTDIVEGSKSAKDAFKDLIKNMIMGLIQAINQALAARIVGTILSSFGFGAAPIAAASGGVVPGSMQAPTAFAKGGVMPGGMQAPQQFAKGGVMAGAMMAAATGLPLKQYAYGGVTSQPQVAIFGEGKGAEAFVPLPGPNRGIPVEFKSAPGGSTIVVNYSPNINALDGRSTKEVLLREARVIGDIVAAEISTGSNRGLTDVVRGRSSKT